MKPAGVAARLVRGLAWGVACGLVAAGCGHHPSPGSRPTPSSNIPLDGPSWHPVPGVPSVETPRPLEGEPSLRKVDAAAAAGSSRLAGEQYALDVAHLLTDVRPGLLGADAVGEVAASTMKPATHAFLVQDMDNQHKIGLGRHFDTSLDMWIRSRPSGPLEAPDRIAVEIAGDLEGGYGTFHAWYRMRLDVTDVEGAWRLESWSGGRSGPGAPANLTAAEQREFLPGPGWRRIPAA
jgi:hypothetical protein